MSEPRSFTGEEIILSTVARFLDPAIFADDEPEEYKRSIAEAKKLLAEQDKDPLFKSVLPPLPDGF